MEKKTEKINVLLDNEYGKIELENGIIIATWKAAFIDLETAQKAVSNRLTVFAGQNYPVLVKIKSIKDSTKEARDFLASEQAGKGIIAGAIHVDSIIENMLATFFIYLNKPVTPTKIFKDETKAKEWLAQFL